MVRKNWAPERRQALITGDSRPSRRALRSAYWPPALGHQPGDHRARLGVPVNRAQECVDIDDHLPIDFSSNVTAQVSCAQCAVTIDSG